MEVEIKCPFCQDGFVKETSSDTSVGDRDDDFEPGSDRKDRARSLWAPILLGGRRRLTRDEGHPYEDEEPQESEQEQEEHEPHQSLICKRRSGAVILHLLQGMRVGIASESDTNETYSGSSASSSETERVILINPFNQDVILQGSFDFNQNSNNDLNNNQDFCYYANTIFIINNLNNNHNGMGLPLLRKKQWKRCPRFQIPVVASDGSKEGGDLSSIDSNREEFSIGGGSERGAA